MEEAKIKVELDREHKKVDIEDDIGSMWLYLPYEQAKTMAVEVLRLIGVEESGKGVKGLYVNFVHPEEQHEAEGTNQSPVRGLPERSNERGKD